MLISFFAYFDRKEQFASTPTVFSKYVLFCLKSGSFRYQIGSGQWHTAKENALVVCPPNTEFLAEMLEPAALVMAKFTVSEEISLPDAPIYPQDTARVLSDLKYLTQEGFTFTHTPTDALCHYCKDLWFLVLDTAKNEQTPLADAYRYICSHYPEDISINQLAQRYGYATPRFIALFHKYYGAPPKSIILKKRITKAQRLLLQTDLPVGEISLQCGYEDTLYFSRVFSKYCGVSPSQFRKREYL